jgi:uncharacterized membrane protein
MPQLSNLDFIAIFIIMMSWALFAWIADFSPVRKHSISWLMARERKRWMLVMMERQLRIVDVSIINGLQQGSAFFASFSVLSIGGCFALLGATDDVLHLLSNLPIDIETSRELWEMKILGLAGIFSYSFFKFAWSYRLFMYCSILVGGVRPLEDIKTVEQNKTTRLQAIKAAGINTIGAKHFNAGQKGVFFSMGYLGWFVSPELLIAGSLLTLIVLLRRQFFSNSQKVIGVDIDDEAEPERSDPD